jgi:peptidoglycan/xylan/chitin deacetylase (PgdA/CDA1 family)
MRLRRTVIAYHAIGTCPPEEDPHELFVSEGAFEAQMGFLSRKRNVVPLEAIVDGPIPSSKPAVAITFDDAYRSVLEVAAPILSKYKLPSTIFVPTGWMGLQNGWIEPPSRPLDIMGPEELRDAERKGIRVESHGSVHMKYWEGRPSDVEADVRSSMERLTEVLGRPPSYLAYPFGPTSVDASKIVERCGLAAAFTLERPHEGRYAFERVWIRPGYGLRVFALKTSGYWSASWRWSKAGRAAAALLRPIIGRGRSDH